MRLITLPVSAFFLLAMYAHAQERPVVGGPPPMPEDTYHMDPDGITVEDFVTGLEAVWDIEFLPDGAALISERPGRIRYVDPDGQLHDDPWVAPENVTGDDNGGGMMGLALHPDFEESPWVYVMYSAKINGARASRVSRFRHDGPTAGEEEVILDKLPAGNTHFGGRIVFGPNDGMLYVSIGDTGQKGSAQSLHDYRGKILRVTDLGAVPGDNPWAGNRVWARGLRNTHGLAFHPDTGSLFGADHGPSGEWREPLIAQRDEINVLAAGKNYGWPAAVGAPGHDDYVDPILMWEHTAVPPGDLAFYDHDLMPDFKGDLFLATLRTEAVVRIRFQDPDQPYKPTAIEHWFTDRDLGTAPLGEGPSRFGRMRALTVGPDGAIYVGTTNIDRGRGDIRDGDDRVFRILPAGR